MSAGEGIVLFSYALSPRMHMSSQRRRLQNPQVEGQPVKTEFTIKLN